MSIKVTLDHTDTATADRNRQYSFDFTVQGCRFHIFTTVSMNHNDRSEQQNTDENQDAKDQLVEILESALEEARAYQF